LNWEKKVKKSLRWSVITSLVFCVFVACGGEKNTTAVKGEVYPHRWMFVYDYSLLHADSSVSKLDSIARRASASGLNGIALLAQLDRLDIAGTEEITRLKRIKKICDGYGLEIVPIIWSVGYGGPLAQDKNLAAGFGVENALLRVHDGIATLEPDHQVGMRNGGFEKTAAGRPVDFSFKGEPGRVISLDSTTAKEGRYSLRFEDFEQHLRDEAVVGQSIAVRPHRCYKLTCWVKASGLDEARRYGQGWFRMQANAPDGRELQYINPKVPSDTEGWFKAQVAFNSAEYDEVKIALSLGGSKDGVLWVDELSIEEIALANILRRPGAPLKITSDSNGEIYVEGEDFQRVVDDQLDHRFEHDGPPVRIIPEGHISDGEKLRVSYYHSTMMNNHQVSVCMSEPALYELWQGQLELIEQYIQPKNYILDMDEVRMGGTCAACKSRGLSMARILGDCVTKQVKMIRAVNPESEIVVWSDMFDPNHNAGERSGNSYYYVPEEFTGSWNHIPKDLIVACWYFDRRVKSLAHFDSLGFRTMACCAYGGRSSVDPRKWLETMATTSGACGAMHMTYHEHYDDIEEFADIICRRKE
jgi:hypothetical protein